MKIFMITRKSFFIRWLLFSKDEKPQEEHSVIEIEHIQSGSSQRVSSLEEAGQWMRDVQAETEKGREIEAE
ncbi:MAG TPA: hypothetical protein PKE69_07590 [Pyrinomonadaceae bacterium]|nr:hypothetical protein [Pyrinomonadaceae bacterium]